MRSLATALSTDLALDAHAGLPVLLYVATSTPIYRTTWSATVSYGGNTYTPDVFEFGEIGAALRPSSPTLALAIQNLRDPTTDNERPWSTTLAGEDVRGVSVTVTMVLSTDTTADLAEANWIVRQAAIRGNFCHLELGPPSDLSTLYGPEPSLRAQRCRWQFKDRFCRSESSLTTCTTKDVAACMARHTPTALRFSQIPWDTDMRRWDA